MKETRLIVTGAGRLWAALVVLGLLAGAAVARAETMLAGVARVEITPPPGFTLIGYPPSGRTATGVLDPLYARVLVLKVGATRLGLVDLDLVGVFGPDLLATLRSETQRDVSHLIVVAVHTHSGPNPGWNPNPAELAWEKASVEKIAGAVHEAADSADPVRIGVGYGYDYLGHNRLRDERDGSVTWYDKDWSEAPTGPVDPTVAVLRIDDMGGVPLAVLVNYACHPVIYGPDNRSYSADFPGVMTAVVEKAFDGKPMCFYLQGGAGSTNPFHASTTLQQGAVDFCRQAGTELGQVAAGIANRILTTAAVEPSLQVAEDTLALAPRWDFEKWRAADPDNPAVESHAKAASYSVPMTTLLINRQIALCALPGEPFVDFQMQWRARCPVHDCLMLGYSGGFGYFPTIRQAAWGGYGASHSSTWVELGAGEQMVDRAIVRTYEMLGKLTDTPEDLAR
jgi:neutral ceramidase